MVAILVLVAGCGLPAQVRQRTTTTPFATPAGERQLTISAGTFGGWIYTMSAADGRDRWHARADAWVWPLLTNGVLYVASGPDLQARSPADGTVRWHVQLFDQPNRSIITAPVIDHDVIYVPIIGVNGVRFGEIEALSATDGSVLWRYSASGQNSGGIGGISPVVADGTVYVAGDALYVLRASDGHLIRRIESGGGLFGSNPTIQAGIAYFTMNEPLPSRGSAVEAIRVADGARLWYKHISDGAARDLLVAGDSVYASGFIDTNVAGTPGTDGTGSGYGLLYALHSSDGSVQWTFRASGEFSMSPALAGNTLYAGSGDGYLNLIDRTNGTLLRRYRIDQGQYTNSQRYDTIWTTPIVRDGTLYFAATTWDTMFPFHVGERRGAVFAMRERDGVILWEADLLGWVSLLQVSAT